MYYYELFQQDSTTIILSLIISIVLTIVGYGAFPFIFAKTRKKPITKKKYKVLCFVFNIVVMIIFSLSSGGFANGAPYLLWTSVFASVGAKALTKKSLMDKDKPEEKPTEYHPASNYTTVRLTGCKSCGYRNKNDFTACPECGKSKTEYFFVKELKKP